MSDICIKLVAKQHNELSKEESPTCSSLYPTLEMWMSDWEDLLNKKDFEPIYKALCAGSELLKKNYRCADNMDVYFISHGAHSWIEETIT